MLDSYYSQHPDHGAEVNGLVSLGIFYGVCAISVWVECNHRSMKIILVLVCTVGDYSYVPKGGNGDGRTH